MCDPRMDKRNGRLCWLVFEKGVDLSDIMTKVPTQVFRQLIIDW